jgi:hypothetical protein
MGLASAALLSPVLPAYAQYVAQALPPPESPSPSPSPSPTPKPQHQYRGGPINFNLTGSLSLGTNSTSSSFGGPIFTPTPSPGPTSSAGPFPFQNTVTTQNEAELGAGLSADISRRTGQTMTDLKVPFALGARGESQIGVPQFLYSTPKYSLGYGIQELMPLGQLELGSTLRGYQFVLPVKAGQVTFFEGPSLGVNEEAVDLYGALLQEAVHGTL